MSRLMAKLAVVVASTALGFTAIEASPVQAAPVTYNFTVNILDGDLVGQDFSGVFSYDDASLTNNGFETLGIEEGFKLNFEFLGSALTQADSEFAPIHSLDWPGVRFDDGNLLGIVFDWDKDLGLGIGKIRISTFTVFGSGRPDLTETGDFDSSGRISYFKQQAPGTDVTVPEPGTLAGLSIFGLSGLLLKKKVTT